MIKNLKTITANNSKFIKNEEIISTKKLETEVIERDIYQKKRVEIDYFRDVKSWQTKCDEADLEIEERNKRIEQLQKELEEAEKEL